AYVYRVAAVNLGGEGPPSADVSVRPLMIPRTPGDVWITATGDRPLAANPVRGERTQVLLNVPTGTGTLRLTVYTLVGEPVRVLYDGPAPGGQTIVEWDGRNDRGRLVASGGYLLVAELPDGRRVRRKIAIVK
ncbi:MAG: hypothetical protein AAB368_10920, partial [bacterium]